MSTFKAAAPFKDGQSFQYEGNLDNVPDWVDRNWATYDRGPALSVPVGDPLGQPYTSKVARIGDYVYVNKAGDRFHVVTREEMGEEPGDTENAHESNLPPQTTQATLEDLAKNNMLDPNAEQKSQMEARNTQSVALVDGEGSGAPAANQPGTTPPPPPKPAKPAE